MEQMGSMTELGFGWVSPVLAYVMACVGGALGLQCTARATESTGYSRRNWLINAAVAIGTGIWTMHFVAMLGFKVTGTDVRYNVALTLLSLVVAIAVVGVGVFVVGYHHSKTFAVLTGGVVTGLGVAVMHYVGMSAMQVSGSIGYNPLIVALSIVIAMIAAAAALWASLMIRGAVATFAASLVMGIAVSAMHYTGMGAVHVSVTTPDAPVNGATPMQFIFPLTVVLGSYLFLTSAFVAIAPNKRAGPTVAEQVLKRS
jgi:NO-binding membrane sensor protein with MHYT domain